jgi:hypothetical protein
VSDTCWLGLQLHGDIESPWTLVRVCKAIRDEGLVDEFDAGSDITVRDMLGYLDIHTTFVKYECSYGNIEDLEATLQRLGVSYSVDQGAGNGYGAMLWSYTPDDGRNTVIASDGEAMFSVESVDRQLTIGGVSAVNEMIADAHKAVGGALPPLSLSGRAERMVSALMMKEALVPKPAPVLVSGVLAAPSVQASYGVGKTHTVPVK